MKAEFSGVDSEHSGGELLTSRRDVSLKRLTNQCGGPPLVEALIQRVDMVQEDIVLVSR